MKNIRKSLISLLMIFVTSTAIAQVKASSSGYAPINGLKLYYEVYGSGKPLVMIHGAFNTIDMAFGQLIPELSKDRQVIVAEMQGHGRTADIDRPFSFQAMADDVAGLMKHLKIDSADVFGYSMGGGIAQQLAIRHPKTVKKLILVSCTYKYEGWSAETRAILPIISAEMFAGSPLQTEYERLAPNPKYFSAFVSKMRSFVSTSYDFGPDKIKAIPAPTLIITADGDGVTPEHAVEMYRLRNGRYMVDFSPTPKTQLAILPGQSHISVMFQQDLLLSYINPFLNL